MFRAPPTSDNDEHDDPAAFWFARMNSGVTPSPEDEAAYRAWLQADPGNIETYRRCQGFWRELELDAATPQILSMRSRALGGQRPMTRRRALFGLTGGAVAAAAAGVWFLGAPSPARALISTRAGQRLTAPLPDGSEVTLAPLTRLRLDYDGSRRGVMLEAGQAWFNVLADPDRPFTVVAGDRAMIADGSRFQVTLAGETPQVVVEAGSLAVAPRGDRTRVLARLTAGQMTLDAAAGVGAADVETATAWRLGRIVVRDRPLREVVEAFNRYSSETLILGDPKAGDIRISGSFRYDGSEEFSRALAAGFGVSVARQKDGALRISTADGTAKLR